MAPKSELWKYFLKVSKTEAKCKVCAKIIKTSGNTTNLKSHFSLHKIEKNNNVYPNLYLLARKYLSPVGTSVPSERLFSKAGLTITQQINRLSGDALSCLIFLGSLPECYWAC